MTGRSDEFSVTSSPKWSLGPTNKANVPARFADYDTQSPGDTCLGSSTIWRVLMSRCIPGPGDYNHRTDLTGGGFSFGTGDRDKFSKMSTGIPPSAVASPLPYASSNSLIMGDKVHPPIALSSSLQLLLTFQMLLRSTCGHLLLRLAWEANYNHGADRRPHQPRVRGYPQVSDLGVLICNLG